VGAHVDQPLKLKAAAVHRVLMTDGQFKEIFMLGYSRWQLLKGLAVVVGTMSIVSLALIYFIPAPPSTVTMATAFKGSSFEYYGRRYREIFAIERIEDAVSHIRFPLTFTDQLYNLRSHIDIVRRKLTSRANASGQMPAE
jgi:hypothetical protein